MADKRKSSRYSLSKDLSTEAQQKINILGVNILHYERKIEKTMHEAVKKCINDAQNNFKEKDFIQKYNKEDHLKLCQGKLGSFMDKLSFWVDDKVLSQGFLTDMESKLAEKKRRKAQKVKRIQALQQTLSNEIKQYCVEEAEDLLSQQLQEYKIKVKTQQALKLSYEIFNKSTNKFTDYLKDFQETNQKFCEKYKALESKYE